MAIDKTVQAVFDKAMYLIDAQNESTGSTMTSDTTEYRVRTVGILNRYLDRVYPASTTFPTVSNGERPALPDITALTDELDLDAKCVRELLPLALASELMSEENAGLANKFNSEFEAGLMEALARVPAAEEDIENPYGGIEYGEFGHWA